MKYVSGEKDEESCTYLRNWSCNESSTTITEQWKVASFDDLERYMLTTNKLFQVSEIDLL